MPQVRTLLISGANRGIGRAIAERALRDGHRLSLGARDPASMKRSGFPVSKRVQIVPYEASNPDMAAEWVEACLKQFGGVDGVIHCAGIFSRVGLLFSDEQQEEINHLWTVNVLGPWWLTRAAWPALAMSGDGRIITLVSMSGKRVKGGLAGYSASKFALMGLCQTMRNVGWAEGIRVSAICPSWVNTDMASRVEDIPKSDMTQPEDLASITSQLLQLPAASVPFEVAVNCQLER
jgi:NAD(P)-dependent dehydrogenase (short-subunit alcohol dehydrogenase family)